MQTADPAVHDYAEVGSFSELFHGPDVPKALLSPKRFGETLFLDVQTLARQAKVHRNTVTRAPESASLQDYMRAAVRVLAAAYSITGDIDRAVAWYKNEPIQTFSFQTAEQLVSSGRADDVIRYVTSLEAGAAG